MPDYDIDLTLDSLMIPAISATFPFGTKVIPTAENKGGLSTFDVNSNMMLPFTRMRPRVCSADSVTSRVEYDAKIVFSAPQGTTPASGYTLTLGTGDYVGCTVTFTNLLAHACTVRQSDGTTTLFSVPAGQTMSAMWTGTAWRWTTSGTVSANDPTPVSSAAVQSAIGGLVEVTGITSTSNINNGSCFCYKWKHIVVLNGSFNPKTTLALNTTHVIFNGIPAPAVTDMQIMYRGANVAGHRDFVSISGNNVYFDPRFENSDDWYNFQAAYATYS